jgi:hypothetical protein
MALLCNNSLIYNLTALSYISKIWLVVVVITPARVLFVTGLALAINTSEENSPTEEEHNNCQTLYYSIRRKKM